jgi:hypothetical protein
MKIVEGVESTWHYHLAPDDKPFMSLCRRRTMHTGLKLEQWDRTPPGYHIPEKWCAECARLAALGSTGNGKGASR